MGLIYALLESIVGLIVWFLKLPLNIGLLALKFYERVLRARDWLVRFYYKINPGALRAKERKEKAELLITYEELVKKREDLWEELEIQAELLGNFSLKIYNMDAVVFERRLEGITAETLMNEFDVNQLWPYEKIKATAINYENNLFHIFTVCKKLELYGINRGVKQIEVEL